MRHVLFAGSRLEDAFARALAAEGDGTGGDIGLERLHTDDEAAATAALGRAHVYQITSARDDVAPRWHAGAALLARAPNLLAVSTTGVGFDTVDVAACTATGVLAVNQAGSNREAVAEHVLGMMLSLSKRIGEADRAMRRSGAAQGGAAQDGESVSRFKLVGRDIFGKTLGIVGFGAIGRRIAEVVRPFAMPVLAYDPYVPAETVAAGGGRKVEVLDDLLAASDFVSINCPLTAETRGMIGAREYALMRPDACFITTARGGIHDEDALLAALREGRLAGAGLDVWDVEPPPPSHPLLQLDTVIATPHTAGSTQEARTTMAVFAAEQIRRILRGERPERLLNPESWPAYAERHARIVGCPPGGGAPAQDRTETGGATAAEDR